MTNKHTQIIYEHFEFLSSNTQLSIDMLEIYQERNIMSLRALQAMKRLYQETESEYDIAANFYHDLAKRGETAFKIFYEVSQEEETRLSDEVLEILVQGLPCTNTFVDLKEYNFDDKTQLDGTSYPELPWESDGTETPIFQRYEMDPDGAKFAMIMNMTFFDVQEKMDSVQLDSITIARVLKEFGFTIYEVEGRLYGEELKETLESFKNKCHGGVVCIVVILSHSNGIIINSNNDIDSINLDILKQFNDINFKEFEGKPKLFFFQEYKAGQHDFGEDGSSHPIYESTPEKPKTSDWTDTLVCYSTIEGEFSYSEKNNGSWFIQCLCEKLKAHRETVDILKILSLVVEEMKVVWASSDEKQNCLWANIGFTKEFYF